MFKGKEGAMSDVDKHPFLFVNHRIAEMNSFLAIFKMRPLCKPKYFLLLKNIEMNLNRWELPLLGENLYTLTPNKVPSRLKQLLLFIMNCSFEA